MAELRNKVATKMRPRVQEKVDRVFNFAFPFWERRAFPFWERFLDKFLEMRPPTPGGRGGFVATGYTISTPDLAHIAFPKWERFFNTFVNFSDRFFAFPQQVLQFGNGGINYIGAQLPVGK